jgi:hypothetical protein
MEDIQYTLFSPERPLVGIAYTYLAVHPFDLKKCLEFCIFASSNQAVDAPFRFAINR